jgi:hypothetical protein
VVFAVEVDRLAVRPARVALPVSAHVSPLPFSREGHAQRGNGNERGGKARQTDKSGRERENDILRLVGTAGQVRDLDGSTEVLLGRFRLALLAESLRANMNIK